MSQPNTQGSPNQTPDHTQPVAYDTEGRPLYYHPPTTPTPPTTTPPQETNFQPHSHVTAQPSSYEGHNFDPRMRSQYGNEPNVVHTARSLEPAVSEISEGLRRVHEESLAHYPFLNLSEGEFVMMRVRRHPIGLFIPVSVTSLIVIAFLSIAFLYPDMYAQSSGALPAPGAVVGALLIGTLLSLIGGMIAVWVYLQNQFFLTNESVIQEIQHSLFSRHEQTVSLGSVEDASFKQYGLFPSLFNYGIIRLSTEGDETTYRFNYVTRPKEQVAIVSNAVEAFKNGRPVGREFYT